MKAASLLRVLGIKLKPLKPVLDTSTAEYWRTQAVHQLMRGEGTKDVIESLALAYYQETKK